MKELFLNGWGSEEDLLIGDGVERIFGKVFVGGRGEGVEHLNIIVKKIIFPLFSFKMMMPRFLFRFRIVRSYYFISLSLGSLELQSNFSTTS